MSTNQTFLDTKQTIIEIISNSTKEVTPYTNFKTSGVYILFVNNFTNDKIIPFYIGQTTNFQNRYKKHLRDIKDLNSYSYAEYHNIFVWAAFKGYCKFDKKLRPCKIFKYMIEQNCFLSDLRMVVLEECEKDKLKETERKYLEKFLPAFFGFNQIDSITESWNNDNTPSFYEKLTQTDSENFLKYMGYGFTEFNYLLAFQNSPYNKYKDFLDKKLSKLIKNTKQKEPFEFNLNSASLLQKYNNIFAEAKLSLTSLLADKIHEIFEQCKLKSKSRETEVLWIFLNHYNTNIVSDISDLRKYLEYYMNRNKNSRTCGERLHQLYMKYQEQIQVINEPVMNAFKDYINSRIFALESSKYYLIFPNIEYSDFPIRDN